MKLIILALIIIPLYAHSQTKLNKSIDLNEICSDQPLKQPLIIMDQGFCSIFLQKEVETLKGVSNLDINKKINHQTEDCNTSTTPPSSNNKVADKWKIRFYASHSFTTYFNTDVTFNSSRYNVVVQDYEWAERSSRKYFLPETWKEDGNNPFQMIDEPSNTFTVSIEKDGLEFFLSAFHPKFEQGDNFNKLTKGTIDGVAVNGYQDVKYKFPGYTFIPGQSPVVRNENTHKQMTFEIGAGYRFKIMQNKKLGTISYIPSAGIGVMVGENFSNVVKEGHWWDYEGYVDEYGVQGYGGSITNRVELNTPKERFGLFYENKLGYYKLEHGFLDGTQKYNLGYMGNSVGAKFMIYDPKNKKKKRTPAGY